VADVVDVELGMKSTVGLIDGNTVVRVDALATSSVGGNVADVVDVELGVRSTVGLIDWKSDMRADTLATSSVGGTVVSENAEGAPSSTMDEIKKTRHLIVGKLFFSGSSMQL